LDAPFRARFPWFGADLQTIRNALVRPRPRFADAPAERLTLPMPDDSGDALLAEWHRRRAAPATVVLVHGLTGCAESFYVLATARALLDAGYAVVRLNLRGAGPSAGLCREQYHAARSADLAAVFSALAARAGTALTAIGYSLGGQQLLKHLGEAGQHTALAAAASISAPIDLAAAARRFHRPRNAVYQRYLLTRMKREVAASRGGLPPALATAAAGARTVYGFDDAYVAPRYGFASADDYYARASATGFLAGVAVPTLALHAADDPWIPADSYRGFDWSRAPGVTPVVLGGGGHVGFHAAGSSVGEHDRRAIAFFDGVLGRNR
jgi:uncharacterized protein